MKRTPPWVIVASVGLQLATLGLCLWVMDRDRARGQRVLEPPKPPEPPREVPAHAPASEAVSPPPPAATPMFGPPPERPEPIEAPPVPRFITEVADPTSQLTRGHADAGAVFFGFYLDGNIRCVDVDGGTYSGKAESARARMREIGGLRAFTVQIGVGAGKQLRATFTGGPHDAETIGLEPLVGWSVA
ncbi:MAG: hypothetical protein JOZ86_01990 [Candidatus Eremiobacteraeota bacterium]|nr:hypothetical protein [Candidatus Eremiobacteraeota bacterium]